MSLLRCSAAQHGFRSSLLRLGCSQICPGWLCSPEQAESRLAVRAEQSAAKKANHSRCFAPFHFNGVKNNVNRSWLSYEFGMLKQSKSRRQSHLRAPHMSKGITSRSHEPCFFLGKHSSARLSLWRDGPQALQRPVRPKRCPLIWRNILFLFSIFTISHEQWQVVS